jgi:uncharacterized membrane protein
MTPDLMQHVAEQMDPQQLREELQQGDMPELRRRRAVIGLSLAGMASMTAVSLLQTGVFKHLPDRPLEGFNSDKVNSSTTAYQFGVPDGALSLASFAANVPIAALGGADRARTQPWVPLLAAGKAIVDAGAAAWYFYQMPAKEKAWCGYCIVGALASFGIFALALPEARRALAAVREPREAANRVSDKI